MIDRKLLVLVMAAIAAHAQAPKSFEVASIRPVDSSKAAPAPAPAGPPPSAPKRGPLLPPPPGVSSPSLNGRFSFTATVYQFIRRAFELPNCASGINEGECPWLVGGPGWIRRDTYAIQATLPAGTSDYTFQQFFEGRATEINAMLATLLRERFALKAHREPKDLPAFVLTVNRGGHKLRPAQVRTFTAPDGTQQPLQRPVALMLYTAPNGVRMLRMNAVNQSMEEIASSLSFFLDRAVVDQTGLTGRFDFEMEYEADPDNPGPGEMRGPALVTAFQEQAGLRLESTRAPIEVLVIDSIERPSEN